MLTVWLPVLFPTAVAGVRMGMLRAGLEMPGALTRAQAVPVVVKAIDSPLLLDSPSAATNTNGNSVEPLACRVMLDSLTVSRGLFWLFASWYRMGLPGMLLNALLPKAAPVHEGTGRAYMLAPAVLPGMILSVKVR